ncbi:hypothetical protein AB0M44_23220 [Streptosporangium subroseum]|uniref:hypothetical protein n=1 Tax=Streptosporangium subroseum TaxID=106412 RepID=UPI003428B6EB
MRSRVLVILAFCTAVPALSVSSALAHTDGVFAAVSSGPDDKGAQQPGRPGSSSTSVSVRVLAPTPTPTPTPAPTDSESGSGNSNSVNVQSGGSDSTGSGSGGSCSADSGRGGPCSVNSGTGEGPALPFTGVDGRQLMIRVLTGVGAVLFGAALVWLSIRRRRFHGRA